ncbi:Uncharacterised protein [uncultured archaeon]|nr:Uncharacterised protein [uncultured archaeon]
MGISSNLRTAFFFAMKDIIKDKKIFLFIFIAISFGTANAMIINGITDGLVLDLVDNTINSNTGHITIYPDQDKQYIEGVGVKEMKLKSMSGIVAYSSRLQVGGVIKNKGMAKSVSIVALDPANEEKISTIFEKIESGKALSSRDSNDIIISFRIQEDMGINTGDEVILTFENGNSKLYNVKGIIHTGVPAVDANTVYIPIEEAKQQLGMQDKASVILVRLTDKNSAAGYKPIIKQELELSDVRTWKEEVEYTLSSAATMNQLGNTIVLISLIAANVSVAVIIYVSIVNKRRQIGIMKSIGVKNSLIFTIFLIEAMFFGIAGVIGGDMLGYAVIRYLENHPFYDPLSREYLGARFGIYLLFSASMTSFGTSVLAGVYPAINAGKTNIIQAIYGGR